MGDGQRGVGLGRKGCWRVLGRSAELAAVYEILYWGLPSVSAACGEERCSVLCFCGGTLAGLKSTGSNSSLLWV